MFQFPGFPRVGLCVHPTVTGRSPRRVSPFGYLRISACLRLPVAFRSLPRPSSALGAWASALCSSSLDFLRFALTMRCRCICLAINTTAYYPETNYFAILSDGRDGFPSLQLALLTLLFLHSLCAQLRRLPGFLLQPT